MTEKVPAQGPSAGGGIACSASAFLQGFYFFCPHQKWLKHGFSFGINAQSSRCLRAGWGCEGVWGEGVRVGVSRAPASLLMLGCHSPESNLTSASGFFAPFSRRSLPDWPVCLLQGKEWMCQVCRAAAGAHGKHIRSQSASRCL